MKWHWIMGRNCLNEVLKRAPERIVEVYTAASNEPLIREIEQLKIPLFVTSKKKLSACVGSESHQLFAAKVRNRTMPPLREWSAALPEQSMLVFCDALQDPHNLGAILRAAECLGAAAVVYSKNRSVALTPVVSKVSVGASELVPVFSVANLADEVRALKKEGFSIVAAEGKAGACSLFSWQFADKTALILGSEGKGIQPLLLRLADKRLAIPLAGAIDSLNVAQAAAVFLASWSAQRASL